MIGPNVAFGVVAGLSGAMASALEPGRLDPNHVALVFNRNSRPSGELALYYANRRGVSQTRMIGLDLPADEVLPRTRYEPSVARPIREWLAGRGLAGQIVCLVTLYDVPIRIGPQPMTAEMRAAFNRARRQQQEALAAYRRVWADMDAIARPIDAPAATQPKRRVKRAAEIRKQFRAALVQAMQRASKLRDPADVRLAKRRLLACMEQAEGLSGILLHVRRTGGDDAHLGETQLDKLRQTVREGEAKINTLLRAGPLAPERTEACRLIRQLAGLIGLLSHLELDIKRLKGTDTVAALDSELSMLWAPPAGLYRWRFNTLNARHRASKALRGALGEREMQAPVLMVSRLDGPTPEVVRRIIDDAVSTEKVGLKGRAYVDARGLEASRGRGSYGFYDEDLRSLASMMRTKTSLPTVLDNRSELFGPAACREAAIYCGWYSVGRYRDAFDFVRGAVGFHIASSEAISLHDPKRRYWCKELLADGVAATLGPVDEPYLSAFPRPTEFFGLLLTGRYTLVECFYYSKPYNSWMMLLVGDPLYRPFAVNPQLEVESVLPADALPLQPVPTSQPVPATQAQ